MEKRQESVFEGHTVNITSIIITSDNKYIISGGGYGDCTIRIWNFLEKRQEIVLKGHTDSVYSLAITSDSKYLISGGNDKTVRIWNLLEKDKKLFLKGMHLMQHT